MAGVRDPAFWKRFSVAVHMDEEQQRDAKDPKNDNWLARQRAKKARRTYVCYGFWVGFAILAGLLVILIIWMYNNVKIEMPDLSPEPTQQAPPPASTGQKQGASPNRLRLM